MLEQNIFLKVALIEMQLISKSLHFLSMCASNQPLLDLRSYSQACN